MATDTKTDSDDIVVFEDSQGNEISNDPRWFARKVLGSEGVDVAAMEAELEELRAFKAAQVATPAQPQTQNPPAEDDLGDAEDEPEDDKYSALKGAELKDLAKTEGLDITGLKTVGEVRKAFRDRDAAAASGN